MDTRIARLVWVLNPCLFYLFYHEIDPRVMLLAERGVFKLNVPARSRKNQ
jgi:hypothetical protein